MHVSFPYYEDRLAELPRGAEMLIEPDPDPQSGGGPSTIGTRFIGSFVIPPVLEFEDGVIVRAYYRPYSPGLSSADYDDFTFPYVEVTPAAPYQVTADIETEREIYALHLMNIRYRNVQRFAGQAIPISFAYRPPDEEVCFLGNQPAAATGFLSSQVLITQGEPPPTSQQGGYRIDPPPYVNLIVYNRDLGRAQPSNAFPGLTNVGDRHNIPVGNLFFEVPLLETHGHGLNTDLTLFYNSLQAIYQDSLEFYQRLNGVPDSVIAEYWCRNPVGRGWTHSYNVYVREYVRPQDVEGRNLARFREVVCPDGNRIQFQQVLGGANGDGRYAPVSEADHWEGSAEIGHSLLLDVVGSTATLRALLGMEWIFEDGLLTKVHTPLTRTTSTAPLTVRTSASQTVIEDSSGRQTTIQLVPEGRARFSGQLRIDQPDGLASSILCQQGRISSIVCSGRQPWAFQYHAAIGQSDACSMLQVLVDPRAKESSYSYYTGAALEGVPETVARDFWGRLGAVQKGVQQVRRQLWLYQEFSRTRQIVFHRDARKMDFEIAIDVVRLAAVSLRYVRKNRNATTFELQDAPVYDPAAGSASLPLRHLTTTTYHAGTKLVHEFTDLQRSVTKFEYLTVPGTSHYQLERTTHPNQTEEKREYDAATRLIWKAYTPVKPGETFSDPAYTELLYNTAFQVVSKISPAVTVEGVVVSGITETWQFNATTGRLEGHTDLAGVSWTFGYEEEDRDPQKTGQPTSRTGTLTDRTLTWRIGYDRLGRTKYEFDPLFGEIQTYDYHVLGPLEDVHLQPIPTDNGVQGGTLHTGFDAMLHKTDYITPASTESWQYSEHGEVESRTDAMRFSYSYTYTETGLPSKQTSPNAAEVRYSYDELGRVIRKHFPAPDNRAVERRSENFTIAIEHNDEERKIFSRRYRTRDTGDPGDLLLENEDSFENGRVATQTTRHKLGNQYEAIKFTYDRWGSVATVEWYDASALKRKRVNTQDEWGRLVKEVYSDGGATMQRTSEMVFRADGMHLKTTMSRFSDGTVPVSSSSYDQLGRLTERKSSAGVVIQKVSYADFGNDPTAAAQATVTEEAQDPSAPVATDRLITARIQKFNRRGLVQSFQVGSTTGPEKSFVYDVTGQVIREQDADGSKLHYELDAIGRAKRVERESSQWSVISFSSRDRNDPTMIRQARALLEESTYSWNGQVETSSKHGVTTTNSFDKHGRLQKVDSRAANTQPITDQEVTYDALGRITKRFLPRDTTQTYSYVDDLRTVRSAWESPGLTLRTELVHNWHSFPVKYTFTEFTIQDASGISTKPVRLEYEYNLLGELERKKYVYDSTDEDFASITYRYDGPGLMAEQTVALHSPETHTSVAFKKTMTYDGDLRLTRMTGEMDGGPRRGKPRPYRFQMNPAGYIKEYTRPFWLDPNYTEYGSTYFEHDTRGRLLHIKDGPSLASPYTDLELHYQRPTGRSYLVADFPVVRKDLSNPEALKTVTYTVRYQTGREETYKQDYIYNGSEIDAWVTAYSSADGTRRDDWRLAESTSIQGRRAEYSYRRYHWQLPAASAVQKFDYRVKNEFTLYGKVWETYGERNFSSAFDFAFGTAIAVSQEGRKSTFRDFRTVDPMTQLPGVSHMVSEDTASTATGAVPGGYALYRRFIHNAAGQLSGIRHQMLRRPATSQDFDTSLRGTGDSLSNYTHIEYGPDGQEIYRLDSAQGSTQATIFVSDANTTVAEMDYFGHRFRYYETVPGIGLRLSVIQGNFSNDTSASASHDHTVDAELHYHWDHRGATTCLTDQSHLLAADFGISMPDSQTDLFGTSRDPLSQPQVISGFHLRNANIDPWSFYDVAPSLLDTGIGQCAAAQERSEQILGVCGDPSQPFATGNNYGLVLTPFSFPVATVGVGQALYGSIVDTVRGIADGLTGGYASKAREYLYDYDQDLAGVQNPLCFRAGYYTGIVMGLYIGFKAAPLGAANVSTLARLATLFNVTMDVVGFVHAMQSLRAGKATFFDYIALAAPLAHFSALRAPDARQASVLDSLERAANGGVLDIAQTVGSKAVVVLKMTPRMARKEVSAFLKYSHLAQVLPNARGKRISQIQGIARQLEPGRDVIALTEGVVQRLSSMFPGLRIRREYSTVGQVDSLYRALWRRLLQEAGDSLEGWAAGHRLDLGVNRIGAHYEVRAFKTIMENLTSGNPEVRELGKQLIMRMFQKHLASSNSAVGSSWTKAISNGLAEGSQFVVRGG